MRVKIYGDTVLKKPFFFFVKIGQKITQHFSKALAHTLYEIETMLEIAEERVHEWQDWFETCREEGDREGMKEAARNYKALQGVVKCLKWVLGEEGIPNPLE